VTKGLHKFKFKEACTETGAVVNNAGVIQSRDNSNLLIRLTLSKTRGNDNDLSLLR